MGRIKIIVEELTHTYFWNFFILQNPQIRESRLMKITKNSEFSMSVFLDIIIQYTLFPIVTFIIHSCNLHSEIVYWKYLSINQHYPRLRLRPWINIQSTNLHTFSNTLSDRRAHLRWDEQTPSIFACRVLVKICFPHWRIRALLERSGSSNNDVS